MEGRDETFFSYEEKQELMINVGYLGEASEICPVSSHYYQGEPFSLGRLMPGEAVLLGSTHTQYHLLNT